MTRTLAVVAVLVVMGLVAWLGLPGCAALQPGARHEAALELGVKAATARVLAEHPQWRPEVLRIADGALALVGRDELTALGVLAGRS